jgi:hypothetical protein
MFSQFSADCPYLDIHWTVQDQSIVSDRILDQFNSGKSPPGLAKRPWALEMVRAPGAARPGCLFLAE